MANITFNLNQNLINFIKQFANKNWITQKEVIEMSLLNIRKQEMIKEIRRESKELWENNNKDLLFLADSWLSDYNNIIKKIENE